MLPNPHAVHRILLLRPREKHSLDQSPGMWALRRLYQVPLAALHIQEYYQGHSVVTQFSHQKAGGLIAGLNVIRRLGRWRWSYTYYTKPVKKCLCNGHLLFPSKNTESNNIDNHHPNTDKSQLGQNFD